MYIPTFVRHSNRSRMRTFVVAGLAIAIMPVSAIAEETFEVVGFDPGTYSPEAQDGMKEIYSGRMFNSAAPLSFLEAMAAEDAARCWRRGWPMGVCRPSLNAPRSN